MSKPKLRILYAASEIAPFLETTAAADFVQKLPKHMQQMDMEVRILVPRFGLINERRNRLHEVVRLSGINIMVGEEKKSLVVKVSSIPSAKLQVYFVDNEEYFKRKARFYSKQGDFFQDNDERLIFFCVGVLATIKRLERAPDIIHCHDWIASLIPMYLKKVYNSEPILKKAKTIFTLYNNTFKDKFPQHLAQKAMVAGMNQTSVAPLATADFAALIRTGMQYADVVTRTEALSDPAYQGLVDEQEIAHIQNSEEGIEAYAQLYQKIARRKR